MDVHIRKAAALLAVLCLLAGLAAGCGGRTGTGPTVSGSGPTLAPNGETPTQQDGDPQLIPGVYVPTGSQLVKDKVYGEDYISLYDKFGRDGASIKDVTEDPDTGLAYYNAPDGKKYELGLDFLSMAMVYNTDPAGSKYATEDEVYAAWWRYYVTRWNSLLPEIPLYCNEYYDVCSSSIRGTQEHPINPWWGPCRALLDWTSEKADGSVILGSENELTGKFRFPGYCTYDAYHGGSAGDNDIYDLITGLEAVVIDRNGRAAVNPTAVSDLQVTENGDGTVTYTITIHDDLRFSDGSPVTAKNYLYFPMLFASYAAQQAVNTVPYELIHRYVGYRSFHYYNGANDGQSTGYSDVVASRVFSGLRLLGEYQFSVTVTEDFAPYFFDLAYSPALAPTHHSLWVGEGDIADDGEGCYFTDEFYQTDHTERIREHALHPDPSIPCAGPYALASCDEQMQTVTLRRNPYFKGNYEGTKPGIETVIYQKIDPETRLEALIAGSVDYLSGIRDRAEVDELLSLAEGGGYVCTHDTRAGYGKLAFRGDFGPVQFPEVRQAIALCMDRPAFAADYTGGRGIVVDGPYDTGSWMYKTAAKQGLALDPYTVSLDRAVQLLEEGGWIYDKDGNPYVEGVRYKQIPADYATETDISYKSLDETLCTNRVGDYYYMPLVLCWYGSEDNSFTELLENRFGQNELLAAAGFRVDTYLGPFVCMLDQFYQSGPYGWYSPTWRYNVFNFGKTIDPLFDQSFAHTVDPGLFDDCSAYFIKDAADIYWIGG